MILSFFLLLLLTAQAGPSSGGYGPPSVIAYLESRGVEESSGIAASRRNPGIYWTHNDSGNSPLLFAFDRKGRSRGTWRIEGAKNQDWEDIAAGPGPVPGRHYLYIGDIGDNHRDRREVVIYRLEEPRLASAGEEGNKKQTTAASALRFRYPDRNRDAEALLVHPVTGDLYVVTKAQGSDARTTVYKAAAPHDPAKVTPFKRVAELTFPIESAVTLIVGRITGGDISPDGRRVVLCDYFRGYEAVLSKEHSGNFDRIWTQPFVSINLGTRAQGEAVCYRSDGKALLATSEGQPCPLIEVIRTGK